MKKPESGRPAPANPWLTARSRVLRAVALAALVVLSISGLLYVGVDPMIGRDVAAGAVIALMPQLWFVLRGFGQAAGYQAGSLAFGKFVLSGVGFALWFVFVPDAKAAPTLIGTAATIFMIVALTATALRRPMN